MKRNGLILLVFCLLAPRMEAMAYEKISLPHGPGLTRADLYVVPAAGHCAGTLILCPGHNGNGEQLVKDAAWSNFARRENLNLAGLSFASNDNPQDQGYFKAEAGSGDVLLEGLRRSFRSARRPMLLYGFSRGAQFVYTFARWKPALVVAWCAYSATEWESPETGPNEPRGIIACGDEDEPNYSSALLQFLRGRDMDEPWTWVSLAQVSHSRSAALESFVRAYFASVLLDPGTNGLWLDVDTKGLVAPPELQAHPALAAWLPDKSVAELWRNLHQP